MVTEIQVFHLSGGSLVVVAEAVEEEDGAEAAVPVEVDLVALAVAALVVAEREEAGNNI